MYTGLHVECPLLLSDFNSTWIFSTDLKKKTRTSSFTKIRRVGVEPFHTDGKTDRKTDSHEEDNSRFSKFSERS